MNRPAVVLDACVLVPIRLTVALLALAEHGFFTPLWTDEILDEVERNIPRVASISAAAARGRVSSMRRGFGAASLVEGYEPLARTMTCDPKDRHVLAAAVAAESSLIVTFNTKDFPPTSTSPHGVEVATPDEFLMFLYGVDESLVVEVMDQTCARFASPPVTLCAFLASLANTVPTFANLAADGAKDRTARSPFRADVTVDAHDPRELMRNPSDRTNPLFVAGLWWEGDVAEATTLTSPGSPMTDIRQAQRELDGWSLIPTALPVLDAPDDVLYVRFVEETSQTARVLQAYQTPMKFMTLLRESDGTWTVWDVGTHLPLTASILR